MELWFLIIPYLLFLELWFLIIPYLLFLELWFLITPCLQACLSNQKTQKWERDLTISPTTFDYHPVALKRIVTDLKFSTNQMLYQPSWIKDKVIRQRFWRDPLRVSQQTTDQRSKTDKISFEPLALVSRKKDTQPNMGFSSCEQNGFGKETPNPNLTCILSF